MREQKVVKFIVNHKNFDKWGALFGDEADPFVVALAKVYELIVVTNENPRSTKNHIPAAWRLLNVEFINFTELLRRENIRPY
ncbi:MAG: DUF4411 family protein [Candidatus Lokiarchaeota archaeon]